MMSRKIGIIGMGNVGAAVAHGAIALKAWPIVMSL